MGVKSQLLRDLNIAKKQDNSSDFRPYASLSPERSSPKASRQTNILFRPRGGLSEVPKLEGNIGRLNNERTTASLDSSPCTFTTPAFDVANLAIGVAAERM